MSAMHILKPFQANLFNALVLTSMGLWSYLQRTESSSTALIPVGFGLLFALSTPPLKQENRLVLLLISTLTALLVVALLLSLLRMFQASEGWSIFRLCLMMAASSYALIIFLKHKGKWRHPNHDAPV